VLLRHSEFVIRHSSLTGALRDAGPARRATNTALGLVMEAVGGSASR